MRELIHQETVVRTVFHVIVPVEIPGDDLAVSGACQDLVGEDFGLVSHLGCAPDSAQPKSKDSPP